MNKSLIFPVIFVLVCGGIACATKSPESVTQQQPATGQTSDQPAAGTSARVGTTKIPGMEGLPPGSRCTDIDDDTGNCEEAIDPSTKTVYEKERGAWKIDQDDTLKAQGRTDVPGMEGLPTGSRCTDIDDDTGSCEEAIDPSTKTVYEKERGGWKIDQDDTLKAQGRTDVPGMEGLPAGSRCTDIDDDTGKCEEAIDPSTKTVYEKERGGWKIDQDDTLKAQGRAGVPGRE